MSETRNEVRVPGDQGVLAGGGEMGQRMRELDWSLTPLGPVASWPQSLKTAVRIMLTSRQPMFVWWGPELTNLYNDAYRAIVGGKHPQALGQPASLVWREIWDQVGPRAEAALRTNAGTYDEALLLIMERNGYPEETYYTFSYSPIPNDHGGTGGIFCANTDDTGRVIGERQLALLQELAARTTEARTVAEACAMAAAGLASNPYDLPFALIYLVELQEQRAALARASGGIAPDHPAAPASAPLDGGAPWPFAAVTAGQGTTLVADISALGPLPAGAWDRPPQQAALVPIAPAGATGQAGILVAGLSPYRLFDDTYRGFLELVAGQIAAGIASAQAYEEERRRAEALAELDRAKTAFFSNISHEFRTPLTLMLGPIEELLQRPASAIAPDARGQIELIYRNALRLLKLVNSLLDFSRIEAGRMRATYEPTELAAFTAELASLFRSAVERAGLRLVVSCEPLEEPAYIDRELWEKIVFNLLSNAFKFTFEGAIEVSVRQRGRLAELAVRDTGTGIPPEELPNLFERFHRVSGARGRSIEGTGIGLALVQELARLHGGAVEVTSAPGQGSTFTVTVPLGAAHLPPDRIGAGRAEAAPGHAGEGFVEEALRWLPEPSGPPLELAPASVALEPGEATPEAEQPGAQQPKPRVLLADDNADMREYVSRLLAAEYRVEAVADGAAALAAARANPPDLVLSDVMMPRLDGFGLIQALRDDPRTAELPVILLSARAGEEARVEGLQAGADDYLVKPFSARELQARVAARLELVRARLEAARALREREEALRANEERLASLYAQEQAARQQAEAASRLKDDFLATVSHELRTPLTSILGYSHLLQSRKRDEAYVTRTLEKIVRSAQAQAQLIDDLLDVSRIVAGKLRLELRPTDLSGVIRAAIDAVRPALEAKQIALVTAIDERVGPIIGDSDRLQQVVWNLLSNAAKFTEGGGLVRVRLAPCDGCAQISVSDTGRGIPPEFLPHIFDRFRQAESASNRSFGGLGLGLSIVRNLVEMHGGTVWAESAGEGRGTTFNVRLPLNLEPAPDPGGHGAGDAEESAELNGLRVLVVDDQPALLELLHEILVAAGAEVRTGATAREGLAALRAWRPDVLISDIAMPGEDGFWLIGNVQALPPEDGGAVPAAALTAYVRVEDRLRVLASGFQHYVSKPVEPAELLHIVARLAQMGRLEGA